MYYYEVAPTRIIRPASSVFTYSSEQQLHAGQVVAVEAGRKEFVGLVMREVDKPSYDTKLVIRTITETPLPVPLLELAEWMSSYYGTHLATVLQTVLPRGIQKSRRPKQKQTLESIRNRTKNVFTKDQKLASDQIDNLTSGTILVHGVTGSGKTALYVDAAQKTLDAGRSVIVLVPEISLTPQLVDEFSMHFGDVILTHSRQTEAERHLAWLEALDSSKPRIAIGPRSALFIPLAHVGLIVIDEAHEPTFKQEQSPRYSALRAASVLADHAKAKLILGSATPLIADYYVAQAAGRPIVTMTERAQAGAVKPEIELVDMTKRTGFKKHRFLSDKLIAAIETTLAEGNQALVFHNRRGSASTTLCEQCGWSASCTRCFLPMTLHADEHRLRCHVCGLTERVPTSCPVCSSTDIIHKGIGTKLIESEIQRLFPGKTIARFDGDTTTTEQTLEARYKELYDGDIDIIVGTQVIAKGLDLPKLRTVGVVQADAGLALPDYSSTERTFQLLAQVVGRVGRSHHPTTVIVQTYQPTHPSVIDGLHQDYAHFYDHALQERKRAHFPPYTFLLKLTCIYKSEAAAIRQSKALAGVLRSVAAPSVEILGPTPAFYERQRDNYRWQLTLKSSKRADLVALLEHIPPTHWQFELDPTSLL